MDWVATFLEAAGVSPHPDYPLDGKSLLPAFEGKAFERELFWRMKFRAQKAARAGRWKYLSLAGNEFLYDLSRDARERANRAGREPERFADMKARYEAWEKTVPPIPPDALVSTIGGPAELAKPS
jgi:arylsulfatase A-like enzyme